jgi:HEAT repeat protein
MATRASPHGLTAGDAVERAAAAAAFGSCHDLDRRTVDALGGLARDDPEPRVRAAALAALARAAPRADAIGPWHHAVGDAAAAVRRRAAEVAPRVRAPSGPLVTLLADGDPLVVEAAAFALGERGTRAGVRAVGALTAATRHRDPLVREAAVAALGAIGDPRGKDAVLAACADKPAVRRRAVLALAAFDGPDVEAALRRALDDRDWQVRQAAEDLAGPPGRP